MLVLGVLQVRCVRCVKTLTGPHLWFMLRKWHMRVMDRWYYPGDFLLINWGLWKARI